MKPLFFIFFFFLAITASGQIINTIAGSSSTPGYGGDGGPATAALFYAPFAAITDNSGNVYISDARNNRIRKIDNYGIITTIAGTGTAGFSGDGGQATAAQLSFPQGLAFDSSGNLFITDDGNHRIRKINTSGIITTTAGTGTMGSGSGSDGDGGLATAAQLTEPHFIHFDNNQNIYISDEAIYRGRKVNSSGIITTFAGSGSGGYFYGEGVPATTAVMDIPTGVADKGGDIYIADSYNYRIRKVNTSGIITTFAGNGASASSGDGGPATAAGLDAPFGIAFDNNGNMYIAEIDGARIRKIDTSGIITTIAGTGSYGFSGDGGPATAAQLTSPVGVFVDATGSIYIADQYDNRIREIRNYVPFFTHGAIDTIYLCTPAGAFNLDTLLTAIDSNTLQTLTWRALASPHHGSASISYSAAATGGAVIPSACTYTPAAGYTGTDSFSVSVSDGWAADTILFRVIILPPHATLSLSGPSFICTGAAAHFTGTPSGGIWYSSSPAIATISDTGSAHGVMAGSCRFFYSLNTVCSSDTTSLPVNVLSPVHPAIALIATPDIICAGTPVTFSAVTTYPGDSSSFQWRLNGIPAGSDTNSYSIATLTDYDTVTCTLTSNAACAVPSMVTSAPLSIWVYPAGHPTVSFSYTPESVCAGQPVTFTAMATRGGTFPQFRWLAGDSTIATGNPITYSPAHSELITCILTSNDPSLCHLTDTSFQSDTVNITPQVTPFVTIHIVHDTTWYPGEIIAFDAEPTYGGPHPQYQWYLNDAPVPGATTNAWSYTTYWEETVYCVVTSDLPCITYSIDTSNEVTIYPNRLSVNTLLNTNLLTLYPDPNNGNFTLKGTSQSNNVTYQITDVLGKVLSEGKVIVNNGQISQTLYLSNALPDGQYFMRVQSDTDNEVLHFAIRR